MNPRLFIQGLLYSDRRRESLPRRILLFPLFLCSLLYALIMKLRRTFYRTGLCPSFALPCRVVCIGNITLGGTGKTPTVIYLARLLQTRGFAVAVLSRGYQSRRGGAVAVVSDGARVLLNAGDGGDEAVMLARALPGVPIIIGKDRVRAGRLACAQFAPQIILLDDGFQHLRLKRDVDIVLVDRYNGFGNGCLLPRGILREPLGALREADIIILTKPAGESSPSPVEQQIKAQGTRAPLFSARYAIRGLLTLDGSPAGGVQMLAGKQVLALAGIANPGYFTYLLRSHAIRVAEELFLSDHHHYTPEDADKLASFLPRIDVIVTTAKDACKMERSAFHHLPILVLDIVVEMDDEQNFIATLAEFIS